MSNSPLGTLASSAKSEGNFRKKVLTLFAGIVVNPRVPPQLRALTMLILFDLMLVSFTIGLFILNLIGAQFHLTAPVRPEWYIILIATEFMVGMLSAFFLIQRFESFGESKRLEDQLEATARKKSQRSRPKKDPTE